MRIHALEATGELTYAEMGRFQSAANPDDAAGTNDEAAAAKDEQGKPVSNASGTSGATRPRWRPHSTSPTWLSRSRSSGIVVGIALILTGVGLLLLAYAVFLREKELVVRVS